MTHGHTGKAASTGANGWRIAGWGALLALLALPALAMALGADVNWSPGDFAFAALLLGALGAATEGALRAGHGALAQAGMVAGAIAAFATCWINAAVGIIGEPANPLNLGYFGLVALAIGAGFAVRFRLPAMAALAAAMVAGMMAIGLAAELTGRPDWGPALFVTGLWTPSALLLQLARMRA